MKTKYKKELKDLIKKNGFLLLSDNDQPAIVQYISGEKIKGSWWGHPLGNLMYNVSQDLADEKDILVIKLINKKVTYLHCDYWNELLTALIKNQDNNLKKVKNLKKLHLALLDKVEKIGTLKLDKNLFTLTPTELGKLATKLEENLLCYSTSEHTNSGKHVRILKSWSQLFKDLKKSNPKFLKSKKQLDLLASLYE